MANTKAKWIRGTLTFYNAGVSYDPVVSTTAAGTITNYGVSVLAGPAASTYTMDAPKKGITKTLIAHTTFPHSVVASTLTTVYIGSTFRQVTLTPTTKTTARGLSVKLVARSTIKWEAIAPSTNNIAFA